MRDLTLILKNARNGITLPFKSSLILNEKDLPEQKTTEKDFEVEIEYEVNAIVSGRGLNVSLEVSGEELGKEPIAFESKIQFKGSKTFEVLAKDEQEARRKFEGVRDNDIDLSIFSGDEYLTEGISVNVDTFHIKVVRIEELPE